MKKLKFLIALFFVGLIGCAPSLTREEQLAIGFAQHPEWSEYHKKLIKRGTIETGMTVEQVDLAREWNLIFDWGNDKGYSYYNAHIWEKRPYGYDRRACPLTYRFCFYNGKLDDWHKSVDYDY